MNRNSPTASALTSAAVGLILTTPSVRPDLTKPTYKLTIISPSELSGKPPTLPHCPRDFDEMKPLLWVEKRKYYALPSHGPFLQELSDEEDPPCIIQALLLYATNWNAPVHRVLPPSRFSRVESIRLQGSIATGLFGAGHLFEAGSFGLKLSLHPDVALVTVHTYLKELPTRVLDDAQGWHALGHHAMDLAPEPMRHNVPYRLYQEVKALRSRMSGCRNRLLDQVLVSMNRTALQTRGHNDHDALLTLANFWAPAMVRPPTKEECLMCSFMKDERSSLGVGVVLYYMALSKVYAFEAPFEQVKAPEVTPFQEYEMIDRGIWKTIRVWFKYLRSHFQISSK